MNIEREQAKLGKIRKEQLDKMSNKEYYRKINSIKIDWSKQKGESYDEDLLKTIFEIYGKIKDIVIFEEKKVAVIEFFSNFDAENAVSEYNSLN